VELAWLLGHGIGAGTSSYKPTRMQGPIRELLADYQSPPRLRDLASDLPGRQRSDHPRRVAGAGVDRVPGRGEQGRLRQFVLHDSLDHEAIGRSANPSPASFRATSPPQPGLIRSAGRAAAASHARLFPA